MISQPRNQRPGAYPSESASQNATELRTIFIGGIPLSTTFSQVYRYLSHWDRVLQIKLPKDRTTGLLKGYAKAVLASEDGVNRLIAHQPHIIGRLEVGIARWQTQSAYLSDKDASIGRKVYVKIPPNITEEDLKQYFGAFGPIEYLQIKTDPFTNRPRNFCYIVFCDESAANEVVSTSPHKLRQKTLLCEMSRPPHLAKPKSQVAQSQPFKNSKKFCQLQLDHFTTDSFKPTSRHYSKEVAKEVDANHNTRSNVCFRVVIRNPKLLL